MGGVPLPAYGVPVGALSQHFRDPSDDFGRWFHVNLRVVAPAGTYRVAVDVDSKKSDIGVHWKLLRIRRPTVAPSGGASSGYHELARTREAGAIDLIRHPSIAEHPGCIALMLGARRRPWTVGDFAAASTALESILVIGSRTLVWGEPFDGGGLGMHNVHQNQGDPAGSQWWPENGISQDGAVMVERPDGDFDAFVSRFSTQSGRTDDAGHPV